MLTLERLKSLLSYDAETGVWTWIARSAKFSNKRPGDVAGCPDPRGYRRIRIDGKYYKAHRLAWFYVHGEWPPEMIDHRNRKPGEDAFENLRPASRSQNQTNRRGHTASKLKGVYRRVNSDRVKFEVYLSNPRTYVGTFGSPFEAAFNYDRAAKSHYGDFAVLNFPEVHNVALSQ